MELQKLSATTRTPHRKGAARRTRQGGFVPVILYGGGKDVATLKVNAKEISQVLHGRGGEHAIVDLKVEDDPKLDGPAMVKAVQHKPVRGEVLHVDFLRIRLDERIITMVPLVLVGQAPGVVDGGVLDHQCREIEVECLALEVPERFEVDVSALRMGDSVHVAAIAAPPNVTIVTEPERTVAAVHAPRVVRAEEPSAEGAAAEGEEGAEEKGEASKEEEE